MRSIALYCNWGVYVDQQGSIFIPSVHAQYITGLKNTGFDRIILISKRADVKKNEMDYMLDRNSVQLIALPWFVSYLHAVTKLPRLITAFFSLRKFNVDVLYIRTYEPFGWVLSLFSTVSGVKSIIMHYISDPKTAIWANKKDGSIKKLIKSLLFLPEFYLTSFSSLFCRVTSNGPVPKKNVPWFVARRMKVVVESALLSSDIDRYRDFCLTQSDKNILKLLYVGYMRPSKGVSDILDSIYVLKCSGYENFELRLVGDGEYRQELSDKASMLGIEDNVVFVGYLPFGDKLFQEYAAADIFINLSPSETGPRVLLEALNFGCYAITTNVGYAAMLIKDEDVGYILDRADPEKVSDLVIQNYHKKKLIPYGSASGYASYTVEKFFEEVINEA
jgi:glycosyltransferase involved in cell wall biosynthesis